MKRSTLLHSILWIGIVAAMSGCASAGIPTGHWAGRGTYVDYEAGLTKDKPEATTQRSQQGAYETHLTIAKGMAFGRDAMMMNIVSKHGHMLTVQGDETALNILLVKLETLSNGSVLYALFDGSKVKFDEGSAMQALPANTVASATAIPTSRGTVLQIHYDNLLPGMCFSDTFVFDGHALTKTGTLKQVETKDPTQKLTEVHWVEQLQPR